MNTRPKIALSEVFKGRNARGRLLKLLRPGIVSKDELEEIILKEDLPQLVEWLTPIYEASWGAVHHGASAEFRLYHFNGYYFACSNLDCGGGVQGPFKSALQATEAFKGVLACVLPDDANDFSGAVIYHSQIGKKGKKILSRRRAESIFAALTGYEGFLKHKSDAERFDWAEVIPGVFFVDPMKDEVGKELNSLTLAQNKKEEAVAAAAHSRLKKLMRKQKYFDFTFDNSGNLFKSTADSFVMKVPMYSSGKLSAYPTQWIRLCMPDRIGRRVKLKAGIMNMHWGDVSDLVCAGISLTNLG